MSIVAKRPFLLKGNGRQWLPAYHSYGSAIRANNRGTWAYKFCTRPFEVLGDATVKLIAHTLIKHGGDCLSIDWNLKESTQASMRLLFTRIPRKHAYLPNKEETTLLKMSLVEGYKIGN